MQSGVNVWPVAVECHSVLCIILTAEISTQIMSPRLIDLAYSSGVGV